jgi:hypothetical protein
MIKQVIIELEAKAETTGRKEKAEVPNGRILQGVIFCPDDLNNPGFVNAAILNGSQDPLSELQDVRNYRSRDTSYMSNKPLDANGGQYIHFQIQATEYFTADTNFQLVIDYEPTNC